MKDLSELLNLKGKSAIVTGGAKGIGFGIAYRLAEAGAKVLIADMDEAAAKKSTAELTGKGWTAEAIKADVSDEDQVPRHDIRLPRQIRLGRHHGEQCRYLSA